MGLDMYLTKETYVWTYVWPDYAEKYHPNRKDLKLEGCPKVRPERVTKITEEVGYWRKANAIHKWFVDNVQKGQDDCGRYYVPIEKLAELLEVVKKVRKHPRQAVELLPTQSGFFFGSTDYDEWYKEDLKKTEELLESILQDEPEGDYYYQSSW